MHFSILKKKTKNPETNKLQEVSRFCGQSTFLAVDNSVWRPWATTASWAEAARGCAMEVDTGGTEGKDEESCSRICSPRPQLDYQMANLLHVLRQKRLDGGQIPPCPQQHSVQHWALCCMNLRIIHSVIIFCRFWLSWTSNNDHVHNQCFL